MYSDGTTQFFQRLGQACRLIRDLFRHLCLETPGPITAFTTGELPMDQISFKVQLPAEPAEPNDIVGGKLTVIINGQTTEIETQKGQTEVDGLSGPQDAAVDLSFAYVDDAGNVSVTPATASLVLADTVPPVSPGALGVEVTGETIGGVDVSDDAPVDESGTVNEDEGGAVSDSL